MAGAPAAGLVGTDDEPVGTQQLGAFDGPAVRAPEPAATVQSESPDAEPAADLEPEPEIAAAPPSADRYIPPPSERAAVEAAAVAAASLPLSEQPPSTSDLEEPVPVPEFLAGRSTRPRPSPKVAENVTREDVVPSWEISSRYGAQAEPREPRSGSMFSRILTIAAVVIILALGVAAVILVPGLLAGNPGGTQRPTFVAQPSRSPLATASAVAVVPTPSATPTVAQETIEPTPAATPEPSPRLYRIKAGDTLAKVARKFDVTVEEILAANPDVTNPDRIQVGQFIVIPPPT
jgi:LysM repeat protein